MYNTNPDSEITPHPPNDMEPLPHLVTASDRGGFIHCTLSVLWKAEIVPFIASEWVNQKTEADSAIVIGQASLRRIAPICQQIKEMCQSTL